MPPKLRAYVEVTVASRKAPLPDVLVIPVKELVPENSVRERTGRVKRETVDSMPWKVQEDILTVPDETVKRGAYRVSEESLYPFKESVPPATLKGDPVNVVDCRNPPVTERVPEGTLNKEDCRAVDWIVTEDKSIFPLLLILKRLTEVCKFIVIDCIWRVPELTVKTGPLPGERLREEGTGLLLERPELIA